MNSPYYAVDLGLWTLQWGLTYLVHSSVLLGLAWAAAKLVRAPSARDKLWKIALLGGIITASVSTVAVAGIGTPSGSAPIDPQPVVDINSVPPAVQSMATLPVLRREIDIPLPPQNGRPLLEWLLLGAWVVGATLGLLRLFASRRRLHHQLRERHPVRSPELARLLRELGRRAGLSTPVRLTASSTLTTPVALVRSEICVPERALEGLMPRQLKAILAHEIAHLRRRDPVWYGGLMILERLLVLQPLNRVVRRRLQLDAEILCDDWAARETGGLYLAQSIAQVASWTSASEPTPAYAGLTSPGPLSLRVERLLNGEFDCGERHVLLWLFFPLTVMALALIGVPELRLDPRMDQSRTELPAEPASVATRPADPAPAAPLRPEAVSPLVLRLDTAGRIIVGDATGTVYRVRWATGPFWQLEHELEGTITIETRGEITFASDGTRIVAVSEGGHLRVEESGTGVSRRLTVPPPTAGGLQILYLVDSVPRGWDLSSDAEKWLGPLIREFVRTGGRS